MRKLTLVIVPVLLIISFAIFGDRYVPASVEASPDEWKIPASVKRMQNPLDAGDPQHLRSARRIWGQQCRSCHGSEGKGDGSKSKELKSAPGDFSSEKFQAQTDGELFFKTAEGRDEMEGFKGKLSNNEIWQLVIFMRSLGN